MMMMMLKQRYEKERTKHRSSNNNNNSNSNSNSNSNNNNNNNNSRRPRGRGGRGRCSFFSILRTILVGAAVVVVLLFWNVGWGTFFRVREEAIISKEDDAKLIDDYHDHDNDHNDHNHNLNSIGMDHRISDNRIGNSSSISSSNNNRTTTTATTRWSSTQLRNWLRTKNPNNPNKWNTTVIMRKVMDFLAPKPQEGAAAAADVELYNLDAWNQLRALLLLRGSNKKQEEQEQQQQHQQQERSNSSSSSKKKILLVSNGGSSTAGAGNIFQFDRFDEIFVAMILQATRTTDEETIDQQQESQRTTSTSASTSTTTTPDISVINRGHGSAGSAHAGFLMHSLIPADADILIWEFAINDAVVRNCEDINSALIMWLDQVARHSSPPPLVILAYLWDQMFPVDKEEGRIIGRSFQCHERIAARYDFVVGSVNLASYLSNLRWEDWQLMKFFLADHHHPNKMGHLLLAYLLWDLVMDDQRIPITVSSGITSATTSPSRRPETNWTWCTQDSPTNERLLTFSSEKKFPFASWTSVVPRNEENDNDRMLSPPEIVSRYNNNNNNATNASKISTVMYGEAAESREDRQLSIVLPCCSTGERLEFDLMSKSDTTTKNDSTMGYHGGKLVSAFQMLFPEAVVNQDPEDKLSEEHPTVDLSKDLLFELLDSKGKMIESVKNNSSSPPEFLLVTNNTGISCWQGLGGPWLVFTKETLLSRIGFCNRRCNGTDGDGGPSKLVSLQYLALF